MPEEQKTVNMHETKNEAAQKQDPGIKKLNYGWLLFLVVLIIATYFLLNEQGIVAEQLEINLSFLILPVIVVLGGIFIREIYNTYITGTAAKPIGDSFLGLILAVSLYLLLNNPPVPPDYHIAAYAVLLFTIFYIAYMLSGLLLGKRYLLRTMLQSLILFLTGLFLRTILMMTAWGNHLEFEINDQLLIISPADLLFWSFTLISIMLFLSLLTLTNNYNLTMVGFWFASKPSIKFIVVFIIVLYILNLRPFLEQLYDPDFQIYEWLSIAVVFLVLINFITRSFRSVVKEATYAGWGKHQQSVELNKGDYLLELADYIDEFLKRSDKKRLLIYMIGESLQRQLSINQIQNIVGDFIDYQDEPALPLTTFIGKKAREKRNRNRREIVLEEMVTRFGQTGGEKVEN